MSGEPESVHATAIAVGSRAALIRGASGSGKSDLALRCLGLGPSALVHGAIKLVSDDQVVLKRDGPYLRASAPSRLRGKLEIRGLGIIEVDSIAEANIVLVADLAREGPIERFPDPWAFARILGFDVPLLQLLPYESSTPLKLVTAIVMASLPRIIPNA